MSSDARQRARALMERAGAGAQPPAPRAGAPASRPARRRASLSDHPAVLGAVERDRLLREGLRMLDAPNPFYAPHDGVNGATIELDGRQLVNFSGYNYLGLAGHPRVRAAAKDAVDRYGTSCSASRVVSGQIPLHDELEARLAAAYGTADAVLTGSGFLANAAVLGFVLGAGDLAVCDSLVHNSIVSGTRWAGAQRMSFAHNDPKALEALLVRSRDHFGQAMVILEGVYSMDGDIAALPELIEVARRHDCLVMLDEAHSFGVLGERGFGLREYSGVSPDAVDIWMGTLSKSLASYGGFLAGSADFVLALRMAAPGINMFAAGSPPAATAAAIAAFDVMAEEPDRLRRLIDNGRRFAELARETGLNIGVSAGTPIVPVILGDSRLTVIASTALYKAGINANPIAHPAVAEDDARIRFFITSEHTPEQLERAVTVLGEVLASER